MEFTGRLVGVAKDWITGQFHLTFSMNEQEKAEFIDEIKNVDKLSVRAVKYRQKRSLDANAYYWQLLSKVAEKLLLTKSRAHNIMLRKYGQILIIDGKAVYLVLPDTEDAEKTADEAETYHIKPLSQVKEGKGGIMYRTYIMLRGSSDYDTKEMSTLIEGLVSDAKELGIETMTTEEIERMMQQYEKHYAGRHQ